MSYRRRSRPSGASNEGHADYYAVLEVPRNCSEEDIRRAYKKLAVKWHPDKNPHQRELAEEQFKKVAEAYEVLGNPEKRFQYDRYGSTEVPTHAMHDPFDLFREVFGAFDDDFFGGFGSSRRGSRRRRSPFDDDFFGGGMMMGGFGGMHQMMQSMMADMDNFHSGGGTSVSMSTMSGGMGGPSKSVSQHTVIRNGKQVTRTVTRTTQADGTVHEDVEESVNDHTPTQHITGRHHGSRRPSHSRRWLAN